MDRNSPELKEVVKELTVEHSYIVCPRNFFLKWGAIQLIAGIIIDNLWRISPLIKHDEFVSGTLVGMGLYSIMLWIAWQAAKDIMEGRENGGN